MNCIATTFSPSQVRRSLLVAGAGTDSGCSGGVGAFEIAMQQSESAGKMHGWELNLQPFSVCEKDRTMRKMGRAHLPNGCCSFVDAMHIYADPDAHRLIHEAPDYDAKISLGWDMQIVDTAPCERHMAYCPVCTGATCKMSGWPCQDYSLSGLQRGTDGPQLAVACAVGRRGAFSQHALNAIECTSLMPRYLPGDVFGQSYSEWEFFEVEPADCGFEFVSRPRLLLLISLVQGIGGP